MRTALIGGFAALAGPLSGCRDYGYPLGAGVGPFVDLGIPDGGVADAVGGEDGGEDGGDAGVVCGMGDVFDVEYRGFTAIPRDLTVPVGSTVRWTNFDPTPHTATEGAPGTAAPAFDTPVITTGAFAEIDFCEPASYTYWCRTHPDMMFGYTLDVTP